MGKLMQLLLAPWLIWQGRKVRKNTLRLPEAAGPREGQQGSGTPLRLLVLGDSAAAGVGCETQQQALTGQLVSILAPQHQLVWQLWAQSSLTSAGLLELVHAQPAQAFDVVVISVGVNDVTRRTELAAWRNNLEQLMALLKARLQATTIIYTALPPMHKFPALPQPLRWFIGQQAKQLDNLLQLHCQATGAIYLALDFPFEPAYMAVDGFHPSPLAAQLWAEQVSAAYQSA